MKIINSISDLRTLVNEWCGGEFLAPDHDAAVAFIAADLSDRGHAAGLRYGSDWQDFLDGLPEGYIWDTVEQMPGTPEPCIYCGKMQPDPASLVVPKVDDEEGWAAAAGDHEARCEWVLTRAHQLPEEIDLKQYAAGRIRALALGEGGPMGTEHVVAYDDVPGAVRISDGHARDVCETRDEVDAALQAYVDWLNREVM